MTLETLEYWKHWKYIMSQGHLSLAHNVAYIIILETGI